MSLEWLRWRLISYGALEHPVGIIGPLPILDRPGNAGKDGEGILLGINQRKAVALTRRPVGGTWFGLDTLQFSSQFRNLL